MLLWLLSVLLSEILVCGPVLLAPEGIFLQVQNKDPNTVASQDC